MKICPKIVVVLPNPFFPLRPSKYLSGASFLVFDNSQVIMQKTEQFGLKGGYLVNQLSQFSSKLRFLIIFFLKQGPTKKFAFMTDLDLFSKILSLFCPESY